MTITTTGAAPTSPEQVAWCGRKAPCYSFAHMRSLVTAVLLLLAVRAPAHGATKTPATRPAAPDTAGIGAPAGEAVRHYLSGRWLELTGEREAAMNEMTRALSLDPNSPELLLRVSEMASASGQPARALELVDRALASRPHDARGLWLRGAALFNLERPSEALAPLQQACDLDSTNVEFLRTLARVAETLDRLPVIADAWARVVDLDEEDAEGWFQLATAQARLGRFAAADSSLDRSLELNPVRPGAFFLRGLIRESTGEIDPAIGLYQQHLKIHASDVFTRRRLAVLLAHRKRFKEALAEARQVSAARADDPDSHQLVAELEYQVGDAAGAARTLGRMRALAPNDPDMAVRAAGVMIRAGHANDAVQATNRWLSAHGDDPGAGLALARVHAIAGQFDSAAVWARRGVAAQPDSLTPRRLLARILQDARRWDEAVRAWQDVRAHQPRDLGVVLDLALCREQAGDLAGAIATGREALALQPDAPSALNFLGYVLADHDRELPEAERLIRRAMELDPDNGAYVDSFGWLLYRLGKLPEARQALERAVELTGGDPTVHEHLGDVYKDLRLTSLAKAEYRASLDGDAHNSRVQNKLQSLH